jgi:hypothetical protein
MATPGTGSDKFASLNARLSGGITGDAIDPATIGTGNATSGGSDNGSSGSGNGTGGSFTATADPGTRRKRGRPPGSGSGKTRSQKADSVSADGLSAILFSVHMGIAGMAQNPVWALDKEESASLAEAAKAVADHYNFEASKEVMLWTNLLTVLAMVYGPRVAMQYKQLRDKKPKQQPQRQSEPVKPAPIPDAAPVSNTANVDLPAGFDPSLLAHLGNG